MTLFDKMVSDMRLAPGVAEVNIQHEVMQKIALAGLARGGFFEKAAFYGGTCLHLMHGMRRFSEDMDFSLLKPDLGFRFEDYFPAVVEEFRLAGKEVEIKMKRRRRGVQARREGSRDQDEAQGAAIGDRERVSQGVV